MLQSSFAAASGCHLCGIRLQTSSCSTRYFCSRQRPRHTTHSLFQQGSCGRSRGRGTGLKVQCVQALERPTQESRGEARHTVASARPQQREVPDSSIKTEDLVLPEFDRRTGDVELIVAGAGPSGLAVAERVSQAGNRLQAVLKKLARSQPFIQAKSGVHHIALICDHGLAGFRVCIIDPAPLAHWPNNYGKRAAILHNLVAVLSAQ